MMVAGSVVDLPRRGRKGRKGAVGEIVTGGDKDSRGSEEGGVGADARVRLDGVDLRGLQKKLISAQRHYGLVDDHRNDTI